MNESVKIHAADVDGQDTQAEYLEIEVDDSDNVQGYVLVSISNDAAPLGEGNYYLGIYIDPADARTAGQALIDYANKVEY